ncbi:MAG: hypothetical protein ABSC06_36680 [Rhodopila sp.]|jgi:hypothetical protein
MTTQQGVIPLLNLTDLNEALDELHSRLLRQRLPCEASDGFVPFRSPEEELDTICAAYGLQRQLVVRKFLEKFQVDVATCAMEAWGRALMAAYEVAASRPFDYYDRLADLRRQREEEIRLNAPVELLGDAVEALHGYLENGCDPDAAMEIVSTEFSLKRRALSREFTKRHYPPEWRRKTFA